MSEPPAVGPDRADALREKAFHAACHVPPASLGPDLWGIVDAVLAVAASGAGPTEPSGDDPGSDPARWSDGTRDVLNSALVMQYIDLAANRIPSRRITPGEQTDIRMIVRRAVVAGLRLASGIREQEPASPTKPRLTYQQAAAAWFHRADQEPASDRWFTPQPVDAPPREKL